MIEPLDAGHPEIPADLIELHEILEWETAVKNASNQSGGSWDEVRPPS